MVTTCRTLSSKRTVTLTVRAIVLAGVETELAEPGYSRRRLIRSPITPTDTFSPRGVLLAKQPPAGEISLRPREQLNAMMTRLRDRVLRSDARVVAVGVQDAGL